jgi:LAO/AO transport system ATPase
MARPIRILISKIGLDGHDRGAKLIVRYLRDEGMDVIYTGLWQTPAATVHAAIQEDVDVIGVSLHSAAHMTIMPEVVRLAREAGVSDTPIIVGGIIPAQDKPKLLEAGLAGVFNPGTSLTELSASLRHLAADRRVKIEADSKPVDPSSVAGLARAISCIVEERPDAVAKRARSAARAVTIGVTGSPGVGKSTFICRLARALRSAGKRVGVIAVDPSSPISGGAVLGDRLRMMSPEPDDGLFIRSLSSGNIGGGLAPHCREIVELVAGAGFDVVLIETVGAGQGETDVRNIADQTLILLMPGAGDAVQFFKAGIMEIGAGFVLNKCDLPGADATLKELHESIDDDRPVWSVSALREEGLEPICEWIEALRAGR